ncbi:MAG: hypothetical protein EHM20_00040 [Alphaproteobacteria bacterium]|nr:MAG: hypothetical protein EHM20_12780 [Alphaproteobacteria bacterium]RPJ79813.1 MAG: hypothetical protein EHM20_00040 [Alphaproteobacteria bacterium]
MMTFAKFKEYIGAKIDAATTINVYGTKAAKDAVYPYCVYKLKNIDNPSLIKEIWACEIDYWDKVANNEDEISSDTILTAVEAVKAVFNGGWQVETTGFFKSYLDFADEIPDPVDGIYRFQQRYIIELR